ncbi:MAG: crotonase/enoyl-CoA hydratase family protein [Myxococcota bacterium]|nr:crotonase/enoyl-CoA hydratase family protein [Myxococcota bacterium]
MPERVTVSLEAGVADVRLSRADKLNALDGEMFEALDSTGRELATDRSLRAVVLSGEGRGFCAGLDVMSFMGGGGKTVDLLARGPGSPANLAQRAAWVWTELPVPVIAALHGVVFGGGLQIALAADLRFVTPDARLSVMEVKWGLVPDMTLSQTLPRLVKIDVAKELAYTGRIVPGAEAVELGLATRLSENPRKDALELAREIAGKSPDAVRAAKRLFDEASRIGVEAGLALEEQLQRDLLGGANQLEAVKANAEKRDPAFRDPS